ncbi:MAG: ribonuclease III [Tissierellia bacterium]|nr:ribonuclease III [Tissierellia bacterium]
MDRTKSIQEIEAICNYSFRNKNLLIQAFTHSSILNEDKDRICYERLEFLGDAVIDLIMSEVLFLSFPGENEGQLTEKRAKVVKGTTLAFLCQSLGLENYLELGDSLHLSEIKEEKFGDIIESLIGAIFLDGGYLEAKKTFLSFVDQILPIKIRSDKNPKNVLQEWCQKKHMEDRLEYITYHKEGKDNDPTFFVKVVLDDKVLGKGQGSSKKKAEQEAAQAAIEGYGIYG